MLRVTKRVGPVISNYSFNTKVRSFATGQKNTGRRTASKMEKNERIVRRALGLPVENSTENKNENKARALVKKLNVRTQDYLEYIAEHFKKISEDENISYTGDIVLLVEMVYLEKPTCPEKQALREQIVRVGAEIIARKNVGGS